jgi:hypothetical protein
MKKFLSLSLMAILLVFVVSCEKTDDTDDDGVNAGDKEKLITSIQAQSALGTTTSSVSYTNDLKPEVLGENDGTNGLYVKFTYEGSKFKSGNAFSDAGLSTPAGSVSFTYTGSDITQKVTNFNGETTTYTYTWAGGKVTEVIAEVTGAPFNDYKYVYEYTGDNITKINKFAKDTMNNFVAAGYDAYTYDSKVNPYSVKDYPMYEDVTFISANNPTKIDFYDSYNVPQGKAEFTYTYDSEDLPLTGTFDTGSLSGILTFTYESLSSN